MLVLAFIMIRFYKLGMQNPQKMFLTLYIERHLIIDFMSNMLLRTRLVNWACLSGPISAPPKKIGPMTRPVSLKFFFDPPRSIPMTGWVGPVRPPDPLTFIYILCL